MMCENCCYWDKFYEGDGGEKLGECRRYAPRPKIACKPLMDGEENVKWPITREMEFCGDFKYPQSSGQTKLQISIK
jgi:hypothetical protein